MPSSQEMDWAYYTTPRPTLTQGPTDRSEEKGRLAQQTIPANDNHYI